MKKLIKENKVLFVLAIIIIVSLILMAIGLFTYFYGNDKDKYGDRLNGKEEYVIKDTIGEEIKSLYDEKVENVKVDIRGKIIYITIDVANAVEKNTAKSLANQALEKFSEEEKNFYDIQFLITCTKEEAEEKAYPIEGYKNSSSTNVVWTNN